MRGSKNELTEIVEGAMDDVIALDTQLAMSYGLPLFVTDPGDSERELERWPKDPDELMPEEMAILMATRGQDAVEQWLMEHELARVERQAFDPEHEE